MDITIHKDYLESDNFKVQALFFLPKQENWQPKQPMAIFTHGYTSHKGDVLPWAQRFCQGGIPCAIFDLPGHYLGSYEKIDSFESFSAKTPNLFRVALDKLIKYFHHQQAQQLVVGGHSLGALMALLSLDLLPKLDTLAVAVGYGLNTNMESHIFNTQFYQNTLAIRQQLVADCIQPNKVFPWLQHQKQQPLTQNQNIHLISGEDDVVVGKSGAELLKTNLETQKNEVTLEKPKRLPHHLPATASPHIYTYARKYFGWD